MDSCPGHAFVVQGCSAGQKGLPTRTALWMGKWPLLGDAQGPSAAEPQAYEVVVEAVVVKSLNYRHLANLQPWAQHRRPE